MEFLFLVCNYFNFFFKAQQHFLLKKIEKSKSTNCVDVLAVILSMETK